MNDPLKQFAIKKLIEIDFLGFDISFTNSSFAMLIVCIFISMMLHVATRKCSIGLNRTTPKGLENNLSVDEVLFIGEKELQLLSSQSNVSIIVDSLYRKMHSLIINISGKKSAIFAPLIFTIFLFIFGSNMLGDVPYSFAVTSHISITFSIAIIVFALITITGIVKHRLKFFKLFMPKNIPVILMPLMLIVELFVYLMRPVSLSVRLAANITAGHIVMKILAGFTMLAGLFFALPFMLLVSITGLEIFISILQAYIFTVLTCVYLSEVLYLH